VNGLVERLLMFLESGYDHIVAETLIQLRDLLRRYPDLGEVNTSQQDCRACSHGYIGELELAGLQLSKPAAVSNCRWSWGCGGGLIFGGFSLQDD